MSSMQVSLLVLIATQSSKKGDILEKDEKWLLYSLSK